MPDTVIKIAHLILKYWRQDLEEDELNELLDWANQSTANKDTFARLTDADFMVSNLRELTSLKQEMRDRIWSELHIQGTEPVADDPITEKNKRKFLSISFTTWKYVAAAAVLSAAGLLVLKMIPIRSVAPKPASITATTERSVPEEARQLLATGSIRFADNSVLDPGTMRNGSVLERGKLKLLKEPGGIRILSSGNPHSTDSTLFNTFNTGVGGGYTLWLPDGTEVQLNAASSITFPVAFSSARRVVEASGELYFNVHKKPVPFFVHTPGMNMEVLGTRFNVHVYPEEKLATTTLEEGSLRVWKQVRHTEGLRGSNAKVDIVLVAGQQAQISNFPQGADMGGIRVEQVKVAEVVSWKTGQFIFSEMDCETMARQLSRWYGAKFEFPDGVPDTKFSGWFRRTEKLSAILQSLEGTGEVVFNLEQPGNRVIVKARQ